MASVNNNNSECHHPAAESSLSSRPPPADNNEILEDGRADNSERDDEDEYLVSCRCESAKAISTLLCCLEDVVTNRVGRRDDRNASRRSNGGGSGGSHHHKSLQPVTVFCSPTSLTFHVYGKAKQMQASVDIQASLFSDYSVASPANDGANNNEHYDQPGAEDGWQATSEFCVNLTTLLECMHVLGIHHLQQTKLCFSYSTTKEIFKLELLEESGVLSTAAIPGMLPPDDDLGNSLALAFRSSPIAARIILKSNTLQELIPELQLVSGGTVGTVSLGKHGLVLACTGNLGECSIVVPTKGAHVVSVELPPTSTTNNNENDVPTTYSFSLNALLESMRGLDIAEETCVTINNAGMMAIQHQVIDRTLSESPNFVDFILCSLEDMEDDETNNRASTQSSQALQHEESVPITNEDNDASIAVCHPELSSRIVSHRKRRFQLDESSMDSSDDDNSRARYPAVASNAKLFGSVMTESVSLTPSRRARRRRVAHAKTSQPKGSPNLLDDTDSEDEQTDGSVCMDDFQPLDVTIAPSQNREEVCSSPEIMYGQQH